MKRIALLAGIAILGLAAVFLSLSGLPTVNAQPAIDLMIEAKAPTYVDTGATYVVNLSYANKGTLSAPDNWVTATLPPGTTFVESTYIGGEPRPPDTIVGQVLTWTINPLPADSTWGHILITLDVDDGLAEGTALTFTATIATTAPESDTDNNTASVTTAINYMGGSIKQVQARLAMPADVLTYTITINLSEQGGAGGRLVTLTDTLPPSVQARFLGWSSPETGTFDGHTLRWEGQVRPGVPVILQYQLGVEGDVGHGTIVSNAATLDWAGQQMQLGPVTTAISIPHGVMGLGPGQGGELEHQYGVTLTVPAGAVADTTRFQIGPLFTDTHPVSPPGGLLYANRAFEVTAYRFGDPVGAFNAPLTITVGYSETDVIGLKRETLRLWTRSGPGEPWEMLGEPVQAGPGTLTFTTTHLSQFALFGEPTRRVYLPLLIR